MEHSVALFTCIKIPNGFQAFILSILEWQLKAGFTVVKKHVEINLASELQSLSLLIKTI